MHCQHNIMDKEFNTISKNIILTKSNSNDIEVARLNCYNPDEKETAGIKSFERS